MNFYPIKIIPVPKDIIWGGNLLRDKYGKNSNTSKIAESWELTVRPDGMSVVGNGCYRGMTLEALLKEFPWAVGCDAEPDTFPLLIKFIDACDDLSIQVHPDDSYAAATENDSGKTEMWYIVEATPDAAIVYGLKEGLSEGDFAEHLKCGKTADALNRISVKRGETYYIPAGQVHAICSGVLIAEIQQNSNLTYRIYDYDRVGADGKKRELHVSKAIGTVKCFSSSEIAAEQLASRMGRRKNLADGEVLCDCKYFRVTKFTGDIKLSFTVDEKAFASLLFCDADGVEVSCQGNTVNVTRGDSIFIPAGAGEVTVAGKYVFLLSEI